MHLDELASDLEFCPDLEEKCNRTTTICLVFSIQPSDDQST